MVDEFTQTLLGIMVAVIMLGMGASLTPRDFYLALRRPYGLAI
ncbi:MAG: transporter, partial [Planctomycetota bacterium]